MKSGLEPDIIFGGMAAPSWHSNNTYSKDPFD